MSVAPPIEEAPTEVPADSSPLWEQQENERPLHFARFQRYLQLGPSRSMLGLYNADLHSEGKKPAKSVPSSWDTVAKEWEWVGRAKLYDQHQIRLEREAFENEREKLWEQRRRAIQERVYHVSEKMLSKVEQMIDFPLVRQTIEETYPDGRAKTITIEAPNWSFGTISTFVRGADSILRLALDIEKVRLKAVADQMTDDELIAATESIIGDNADAAQVETEEE